MTIPPHRPLLRLLAVALALGLAFAAPPPARAAASGDGLSGAPAAPPSDDLHALAAEVMAKGKAMRPKLLALFLAAGPDIDAIAARARALIGALEGDPGAATDAAVLISDVAAQAMEAPRVYRATLDPAFALVPGAYGWDLGPALSPLYPGFRRVTPAGLVSGDAPLRSFDLGRGDGLSSDGIFNVRSFTAHVPDGDYRLIVLTGDPGVHRLDRPFAGTIAVAGATLPVANADPRRWIDGARLVAPGGEGDASAAAADGGGDVALDISGFSPDAAGADKPLVGAMVLFVRVSDRRLSVDLAADGKSTYIAGLILEPVEGPSALATPDPLPDPARIMLAEAQVAEAIGGLLESVATAAGGPAARARIFGLASAPVQDAQTVSPN